MIKIKRISFRQAGKVWNELYSANSSSSPYMDYDFQKIYKQRLWFGKSRLGCKYVCLMAVDDSLPCCIIPLIKKKKDYYIAGDLCATGSLDFIYSDEMTEEKLGNIINKLVEYIGGEGHLHLNKVNQSSLLYNVISDKKLSETVCVKICYNNDYDEYFSGLSKSVKQNIRTAKNRMTRENKEWRMEFYAGGIPSSVYKSTMEVYSKRVEEREHVESSWYVRLVRNGFNPISIAHTKLKTSFVAILYIEGNIAGFFSGFFDAKGTAVVVPRLAIDSEYGVYCPGSILVSETIRYLIENTEVRCLDLSRGDEKYKYAMGGIEHYNVNAKL